MCIKVVLKCKYCCNKSVNVLCRICCKYFSEFLKCFDCCVKLFYKLCCKLVGCTKKTCFYLLDCYVKRFDRLVNANYCYVNVAVFVCVLITVCVCFIVVFCNKFTNKYNVFYCFVLSCVLIFISIDKGLCKCIVTIVRRMSRKTGRELHLTVKSKESCKCTIFQKNDFHSFGHYKQSCNTCINASKNVRGCQFDSFVFNFFKQTISYSANNRFDREAGGCIQSKLIKVHVGSCFNITCIFHSSKNCFNKSKVHAH